MRRQLFIFLIPCLGFLFFGFARGEERLTLTRAKELVAQSPRLEASRSEARQMEVEREMTTGHFLPRVTLSQGYSLTNDPVGVFSYKLDQQRFSQADFSIPSLNSPSSEGQWRTRIEVAQPILHSFTDIENQSMMSHRSQAAKLRHEFRMQSLRLQVTQAYYMAVSLAERTKRIDEGIDRLVRLEKGYQVMNAPTAATTTNYLIAQSVRLRLSAEREGINLQKMKAEQDLLTMLGFPAETQLTLVDGLPTVGDINQSNSGDTFQRADVEASKEEYASAKSMIRSTKSEWGPHLDAVGGYNLYSKNYSDVSDFYDVGVMLTWPLFEGHKIWKTEAASQQAKAVEQMVHAYELEGKAAWNKALLSLDSAIKQYQFIEQAEQKAFEALNISAKRYAEGMMPLFDFSQSIQNWVAAKQAVIEAQRQVVASKVQVTFERGAL